MTKRYPDQDPSTSNSPARVVRGPVGWLRRLDESMKVAEDRHDRAEHVDHTDALDAAAKIRERGEAELRRLDTPEARAAEQQRLAGLLPAPTQPETTVADALKAFEQEMTRGGHDPL